jgi:rhamnosyl/mannosyltransferase
VRQRALLRLYEPFLERLLRSADAIILPTPAHYSSSRQLPQWASREKMRVVPFGVDYARFMQRPALADELRRRHGGGFLIFALGRHVYYKGFEFLIRSMRELRDARLIIGGRGPLTESLVALAREQGVHERVELVGRIPEESCRPITTHAMSLHAFPLRGLKPSASCRSKRWPAAGRWCAAT